MIFMFYYTYVLYSLKDKKLYIGSTKDLKQRINQHNHGKVLSTKYRRPLKLIFYEAFNNYKDARRDELFYKSGHGREILKEKIKNSFSK